MDKNELVSELQSKIISTLNLPDMEPQDLEPNTPLFDENGLGLDSVDALELVVMLEKDYGVTIEDKSDAKAAFASVSAMADCIIQNSSN